MHCRLKNIEERRASFLKALADGASVTVATARAGVHRQTVYNWRAVDTGFAAAWDAAFEAGTDRLEEEARRRMQAGRERPVFHGGEVPGPRIDYSDRQLRYMLNMRRPGKFSRHAPKGKANVTVVVRKFFPRASSSEPLATETAPGSPVAVSGERR